MSLVQRVIRYLYRTGFFWTYLPVTIGFSLSAALTAEWLTDGSSDSWGYGISSIGLLLFFLQLRFIADLKNYSIKLSIEPDHPLSSGLITLLELRKVIQIFSLVMPLYGLVVIQVTGFKTFLVYEALAFLLFPIHRDFFLGRFFQEHPVWLSCLKHLGIFFAFGFAISCFKTGLLLDPTTLNFSLLCVCSFIQYDICKNVDAKAPPILNAFYRRLGPIRFYALLLTLCASCVWASTYLRMTRVFVVTESALLLAVIASNFWIALRVRIERFGFATVIIAVWAVPVERLVERFLP